MITDADYQKTGRMIGLHNSLQRINDNEKPYTTAAHRRDYEALGGDAELSRLLAIPGMAARFPTQSGSIFSHTVSMLKDTGLGVGLAVLAGGALLAGTTATAGTAASVTAGTGGSFSASVAAAQAETAALLSTAPVSGFSVGLGYTETALAAASANTAALLSPILSDAALVGTAVQSASALGSVGAAINTSQSIFTGAKDMASIFDGLSGTVADVVSAAQNIGGGIVDVYGKVLGAQTQMVQLDIAKAQALAAAQPQQGISLQSLQDMMNQPNGISWGVVGLAMAALLGVVLVMRK